MRRKLGLILADSIAIVVGVATTFAIQAIVKPVPDLVVTHHLLLAFAVVEAVHVRFRSPGRAIQKVAGRALEAWLDPTCPACGGRGKNGGFGAPLVTCVRCHGFRLRRPRLGDSDEAHEFGRRLLVCMDSRTEYAARQMQKFLRER